MLDKNQSFKRNRTERQSTTWTRTDFLAGALKFAAHSAICLIIVASFVVSAGCAKKQKSDSGEKDEVIRIGAILPLTGALSYFGMHEQNGINLAMKKLRKGGLFKHNISVVYEDHKNEPKLAITQFQRLRGSECRFFITQMSGVSMALASYAGTSDSLLLSLAMHPKLASQGDNVFRIYESITQESKVLSRYIIDNRTERRIAVLHINDVWGREAAETFKSQFEFLGGDIVELADYVPKNPDHRNEISKLLDLKPDAIFIAGYGPSAANIVKQIRETSNLQLFGNIGLSWDFSYKVGGDALDGLILAMPTFYATVGDQSSFVKNFREEFGVNPNMESAFAYDSIMLLAKVFEEVGQCTVEQVRNRLLNMNSYQGVSGEILIDQDGDASMATTAIREWEHGGGLKTLEIVEIVDVE